MPNVSNYALLLKEGSAFLRDLIWRSNPPS